MIIYLLTFASGKKYLGQTIKSLKTRLNNHRQNMRLGSTLPVHNAWRAYGEPVVEVLERCESQDALNAAEIRLISERNLLVPNGYNLAAGGMNGPMHELTRAKISAKATGRLYSDEAKARVSAASLLKWQSQEYREKVRAGVDASFTPERRAHLSVVAKAFHTGRKKTPEHVAKMANRVFTDEARANMSASAKARVRAPHSAETKARIQKAAKEAWVERKNRSKRELNQSI
jgi:hypothetical protein